MDPSEIHRSLLGSQGPGPMFRLNLSLIGPVSKVTKLINNMNNFLPPQTIENKNDHNI
jgi:hypothetical protein